MNLHKVYYTNEITGLDGRTHLSLPIMFDKTEYNPYENRSRFGNL